MTYIAVRIDVIKDGFKQRDWRDLEIEDIIRAKKMVMEIEQEMDLVIFEKEYRKFIEETA